MINYFSLALTHGLMLLAAYLLLRRPDLDRESPADESRVRKRPRGPGDA